MTKPVVVVPEAESEIREAASRYERLAPGLARRFVSSIRRIENHISVNPGLYEQVLGSIRRAPVRRFPYGLFYVDRPEHVRVLAILDLRQNPSSVRALLRRR